MSKERLEEIKGRYLRGLYIGGRLVGKQVFADDMTWLIEQAECVEELIRKQFNLMVELRKLDDRAFDNKEVIDQLKKENKRYKQALEFYAERDNYQWEVSYRPQQEIDCMVIDDSGHTARKALEGDLE